MNAHPIRGTSRSLALALLLLPLLAGARPTRAALRRAFEANLARVVEVVGPRGSGPGVIIGRAGEVLTAVDLVGLQTARVRLAEGLVEATVLMADARLRVAVIALPPGDYAAAAVVLDAAPSVGTWLVGIDRDRKDRPKPRVVQVVRAGRRLAPFVGLNATLSPGTPLFDSRGRLLAIAVAGGGGRSRALSLPWVQQRLVAAPSLP